MMGVAGVEDSRLCIVGGLVELFCLFSCMGVQVGAFWVAFLRDEVCC